MRTALVYFLMSLCKQILVIISKQKKKQMKFIDLLPKDTDYGGVSPAPSPLDVMSCGCHFFRGHCGAMVGATAGWLGWNGAG